MLNFKISFKQKYPHISKRHGGMLKTSEASYGTKPRKRDGLRIKRTFNVVANLTRIATIAFKKFHDMLDIININFTDNKNVVGVQAMAGNQVISASLHLR